MAVGLFNNLESVFLNFKDRGEAGESQSCSPAHVFLMLPLNCLYSLSSLISASFFTVTLYLSCGCQSHLNQNLFDIGEGVPSLPSVCVFVPPRGEAITWWCCVAGQHSLAFTESESE